MQVFVTARAEKNFESIIDHIKEKWGEQTAREFIQKVDEIFKLLKAYPLMGQVESNDIRGFQLSGRLGYSIEYGTIKSSYLPSLT